MEIDKILIIIIKDTIKTLIVKIIHTVLIKKKKRSKFVPIISGFLGVVLLSGGGLYYYSKTTNQPLSSIFSFGKKEKEKEI